jgi:hypothetical protein
MTALEALEAPGARTITPAPTGRGIWRLTLHRRVFSATGTYQSTLLAELTRARNRKIVQAWDQPAMLTFDVDGAAPEAALIQELATDVQAWRWNDRAGADVPIFHGVVTASADTIDESSHVVSFAAHDYLAVLGRRYNTTPAGGAWTNLDQDTLVQNLLNAATTSHTTAAGVLLMPGAYTPLTLTPVAPNGTTRGLSGNLVSRTYLYGQSYLQAIDELAKIASPGGFDYDVLPLGGGVAWNYQVQDRLRIFYPNQGVVRSDNALVYGANVATVGRAVNSDDYANMTQSAGNNQSASAGTAALYAEALNADANPANPTVGLWQAVDTGNGDVIADVGTGTPGTSATLNQRVAGDLNRDGVLIPVYTLGLRPRWWYQGALNMGDTVGLVIKKGRLNVNTQVRVLGITYNIGDDGDENVDLTVGRPNTTLIDILGATASDVEALLRR